MQGRIVRNYNDTSNPLEFLSRPGNLAKSPPLQEPESLSRSPPVTEILYETGCREQISATQFPQISQTVQVSAWTVWQVGNRLEVSCLCGGHVMKTYPVLYSKTQNTGDTKLPFRSWRAAVRFRTSSSAEPLPPPW